MVFRYVAAIVLLSTLAGCGSIGAVGVPWGRDRQVAQPLPAQLPPPTAATPVQSAQLPPLSGTTSTAMTAPGALPPPGSTTMGTMGTTTGFQDQPLAPPGGTQAAMTPSSGGAVGRTDLLGGWTITTAGDSCQLFMTLTSWTGGYRASTRGCATDVLKSISAWNLEGAQVVLAGQGGSPVARLASAGPNRFDGQGISFYR